VTQPSDEQEAAAASETEPVKKGRVWSVWAGKRKRRSRDGIRLAQGVRP